MMMPVIYGPLSIFSSEPCGLSVGPNCRVVKVFSSPVVFVIVCCVFSQTLESLESLVGWQGYFRPNPQEALPCRLHSH